MKNNIELTKAYEMLEPHLDKTFTQLVGDNRTWQKAAAHSFLLTLSEKHTFPIETEADLKQMIDVYGDFTDVLQEDIEILSAGLEQYKKDAASGKAEKDQEEYEKNWESAVVD